MSVGTRPIPRPILQLTVGGVSVDVCGISVLFTVVLLKQQPSSYRQGNSKTPRDQYRADKTPTKSSKKKSNLATQNGHILRSLTSLNDSITGSLTFSEKKPSHYALPTHPTRSEKPHLTPPRSANLLETNAPSLTPNYGYEEMKCTN